MPKIIQDNMLMMLDSVLGSIQSSKFSVDEISGLRQALAKSQSVTVANPPKVASDKAKAPAATPAESAEEKPGEA